MSNIEPNNNAEETQTDEDRPLLGGGVDHSTIDLHGIACACCEPKENEPRVNVRENSVAFTPSSSSHSENDSTFLEPRNSLPLGTQPNVPKPVTRTLSLRKHYKTENAINNLSERLIDAIINNNSAKIDILIKIATEEEIKYRYGAFNNKTAVVIACLEDSVKPGTLSTLLSSIEDKFGKIDLVDELWYGWEPIHYVAQVADPVKMEIVVKYTDVNSLTYFSENALHILIENRRFTVYSNLYNDISLKPCFLISGMSPKALECSNILVKCGIEATHTNFWNESPISLALKYRYFEFMEQLLTEDPYISIDSDDFEDSLKEFQEKMNIPKTSGDFFQEPAVSLFNALKAGDVEGFLRFMNGNISEYVNQVDGESDLNTSGTMLQLCFRKLFMEYLECDKYNTVLLDDECDILDTPLLDVFRVSGMRRCIDHLLNNGADPNKRTRRFGETLLEAAAVRGHYPLVAVLLQHKRTKITPDDIFNILLKSLQSETNELVNHDLYRKYVLTLLLNKLLTLQNNDPFNENQREILNKSLVKLNLSNNVNKTDDAENICQILRLGASLAYKETDKSVAELLDYDILNLHFDDCIDSNVFHYDSIVEDLGESYSETSTLHFLVNDPKKNNLLTTPVLTVLIHEKWFKIIWLFYTNLFIYFLFVFSIYGYVIFTYPGTNIFFYVCLSIHGFKESVEFLIYRGKYFKEVTNIIELIVLFLCLYSVISPNMYVIILMVLLSTVILFLFLVEVPKFTKFTFILGSLKYFFQYAGFYFIPFMSFAIGLYTLFPHPGYESEDPKSNQTFQDKFEMKNNHSFVDIVGDLSIHLFETLILFTGEFNDRVLQPQKYSALGRFFMTAFILCMTIVLNNLLVGLIVSDMDRIEEESRTFKRIKMAKFIIKIDTTRKLLDRYKGLLCNTNFLDLHMFGKGKVKEIQLTDDIKKHFDERNKKRLEELESKKWTLYDENVLKKVYEQIYKDVKD